MVRNGSSVVRGNLTMARRAVAALLCLSLAAIAGADERPGPFVFVYGLQGAGAAAQARELGCNTVYLDLPDDAPQHIERTRELIGGAAAEGLQVIVGLRTKLFGEHRVSPHDPEYSAACREWIGAVVSELKDTDGVAAWATDHYLERDISHTEDDFRRFLLHRHGSLTAINAAWGTDYLRIDEITRTRARALDHKQTYGVGRPSVDCAEYERAAFHDVMQLWAEEIRRIDPETPLMTGRISLYRSLTAIPDSYDVVQVFVPPDIMEPDIATHNVHAVQMARRGGQFEVIPWLRIPLPPSPAYTRSALPAWILEAGLRGAVGVGLHDLERLQASRSVQRSVVEQLAAALGRAPFADEAPEPCAAVLYQPYAGGHQFAGTPAYGYVEEYTVNDVAELACGYRGGTVFGGLDFLCVEDLETVDLDRYSVILAPACLNLPGGAQEAIRRYVERGGAFFGDLGLAMCQSRSWNPAMSPLAAMLGIAGARDPADRYGSFRVGEQHPAFPSVSVGMEAGGTFVPGRGRDLSMGRMRGYAHTGAATEMQGYPFQGPSWFIRPSAETIPLATQSVQFDDEENPYFMGLTVHPVGAGLALFAPFPSWSHWPPTDALHAAVHGDLFGRRALHRLLSDGLLCGDVAIAGTPDRIRLLSRGPARHVQVLSAAADHRVWMGGTCTFSAAERDTTGRRTGIVRLGIDVPARAMARAQAIPVRLRPQSGEAHARVSMCGPGLILLEVGGHGASWGEQRRGGPERFFGGVPTRVRITVDDGLYPVEAGSKHTVTLREGREAEHTQTVTADHRGRLDFWATVTGGRLSITPAKPESP
ncbi:MAG: alpha-amylase family protein [Armatimonadota bacterium]|nr:alpha-amylase family protein [Armatimonadota bacterium]